MRALRFLGLAVMTVAAAGCAALDTFQGPGPAVVSLEVWNRTLDDVFLLDDDGRLISVPACGHAEPAQMAIDRVELRMDAGRISTFASRGIGTPQYLIVVAADGESFPSNQRPVALPACAGHPRAVP